MISAWGQPHPWRPVNRKLPALVVLLVITLVAVVLAMVGAVASIGTASADPKAGNCHHHRGTCPTGPVTRPTSPATTPTTPTTTPTTPATSPTATSTGGITFNHCASPSHTIVGSAAREGRGLSDADTESVDRELGAIADTVRGLGPEPRVGPERYVDG